MCHSKADENSEAFKQQYLFWECVLKLSLKALNCYVC